jgi:hypothetical protein
MSDVAATEAIVAEMESDDVVLDFVDAFRWSWLIDSEIDQSWYAAAAREQLRIRNRIGGSESTTPGMNAKPLPHVTDLRGGATRLFAEWINSGVITEFSAGETLPRWYVLSGADVRRLSELVGQFVCFALAKRYLNAQAVRLVKQDPIRREVALLLEEADDHMLPTMARAKELERLDFKEYSRVGIAILRAALMPEPPQFRTSWGRLRVRLPFTRGDELVWSEEGSRWAQHVVRMIEKRFRGMLWS